jgi:hypothetical protein
MRLIFTLFILLLFSYSAESQKITGIWRGYFSSSNGLYRDGIREEMYKYEVQIDLKKDKSVKGVTYSYKSTVFYGKASMQGIYTPATKTLIIKETGLLELEIGDKSQPCLMTCYLDYTKIDKLEVLQGNFISINLKDKGDCGSGKVYLERVTKSDFTPEDFLLKKNPANTTKTSKNTTVKPIPQNTKPATTSPNPNAKASANKPNLGTQKPAAKTIPNKAITTPKIKPGAENNLVVSPKVAPISSLPIEKSSPVIAEPKKKDTIPNKTKELSPPIKKPLPKVLVERENNLVKTIQTDESLIQIDFYDNGTIDHDSISVFHNNIQLVKNGGLSYTPITLKIKMSKEDPRHEFIMVAENLGEIPPNTALMVITAGKKRYEVFLTSTEEKNAKVIIEYKPKE